MYLYATETTTKVILKCHNCGNTEPLNPKTKEEALVLETNFRSGSSSGGAASGVVVNAYTLQDPTLPHVHNIACRNPECATEGNHALRDIIYIKTDPTNMKFQYICVVCKSEWTN